MCTTQARAWNDSGGGACAFTQLHDSSSFSQSEDGDFTPVLPGEVGRSGSDQSTKILYGPGSVDVVCSASAEASPVAFTLPGSAGRQQLGVLMGGRQPPSLRGSSFLRRC